MKRIVIFGNSGSGKSTLAHQLHKTHNLVHLDLDTLAWQPTTPPKRQPLETSHKVLQQFMKDEDNWVIEGCYADLLDMVKDAATKMIFMDLPVADCIENARNRPWEPHKYDSKEAQDANLDFLIDWIKEYEERTDTFSRQAHQSLFDAFTGEKLRYIENPPQSDL